mmetsp:Transcript_19540/g.52674  ORF Transcript_19540/g.52674 Transcript_19540/m.52674 type:complete len:408 (+) Transcript_19540:186-1409(+)|eukprot:CAMPEP_0185183120 /NCGR_PEP_ID=MMETSP1140-20130426/1762_1 /TAXON_ID=298111 /ORGANISM="Pavlova sp., Strain CCMP459" /LENGTH=407 /DNA_ID=CAMNT_0027749107 /DNA_START=105 /DNA_END=1328 /DNA_ORIENTATION=-
MSKTLPQREHHAHAYTLPVSGWTLTGHSRALERSGFFLHEPRIVLDAGVDLPCPSFAVPRAILVTHGHIDHMNALPMLLRHQDPAHPAVQVMAPHSITHRLRQLCSLSWAVKVDWDEPLPPNYAPPPEGDAGAEPGAVLGHFAQFRPVVAGQDINVAAGKRAVDMLRVRCVRLFHGRCTALGYVISRPPHARKVLRDDLWGCDKDETQRNVKAALALGEQVNVVEQVPMQPLCAYLLDTTVEALLQPTMEAALQDCPVVIIECSFLEEAMESEAAARGHVCWSQLAPFVRDHLGRGRTWILTHFSLRYSDEQIVAFFTDADKSGLHLRHPLLDPQAAASTAQQSTGGGPSEDQLSAAPPAGAADVVLWLDWCGPKELWVERVDAPAAVALRRHAAESPVAPAEAAQG